MTIDRSTLVLPALLSFSDLFEEWGPTEYPVIETGSTKFTSLVKRGTGSFYARARPELCEQIAEHLVVKDDQMYWDIIDDGGTSLVSLKHNKIIGGRKVICVPTESIDGATRPAVVVVEDHTDYGPDTDGVNAIVFLQSLAGITEPKARAAANWRRMNDRAKENTLAAYERFKHARNTAD